MTDTRIVLIPDAREQAEQAVQTIYGILDEYVNAYDSMSRRYTDAQTYLNTVCHQRDDEAEENRCLGLEVERLTREIEELRAAAA